MSIFSAAQIQAASGAIATARVASDKRAERKQPVRPDGKPRAADEVVLNVQSAQSEEAMHATKRDHDEDSAEEEAARQDSLDEHGAPKRPAKPRLDVQG
ncbi:MAG: hypothetical protein K2Q20_12125 [Phycisphaerales bacterium]|nr:hypothetical protein [Phycisphaerales bacterium]